MPLIFKIVDHTEWLRFEQSGVFEGSAVDRADGYIHFSYADQVQETAAKYFRGHSRLVVFACDSTTLGPDLKDEVSRGGALFPHLFAPLRLNSVLWKRPVPLDADGIPVLDLAMVDSR